MKRIIVLSATLLFALTSFTQQAIGIKGGPLFSTISVAGIQDAITPDRKLYAGFEAGLFYEIPITSRLSFVPAVNYQEKGFIVKEGFDMNLFNLPIDMSFKAETRIGFVETPMWLKYTFNDGPVKAYITGGPTLDYASFARIRTKASFILDFNVSEHHLNLNNDTYNRFGFGVGVGGGLEIPVGNGSFLVEAQYKHKITDFLDNPIVDVKLRNYGFGLNVGYKIPLH